jgi:hypothetical protein
MPDRSLDIFLLRTVFERRGDEGGTHEMRGISLSKSELIDVLFQHIAHAVWT